jgi:hypothetical protein
MLDELAPVELPVDALLLAPVAPFDMLPLVPAAVCPFGPAVSFGLLGEPLSCIVAPGVVPGGFLLCGACALTVPKAMHSEPAIAVRISFFMSPPGKIVCAAEKARGLAVSSNRCACDMQIE